MGFLLRKYLFKIYIFARTTAVLRYIFTHLSPLAKIIFNSKDEDLLNFLVDDNQRIEPSWSVLGPSLVSCFLDCLLL